MWMNTLRRILRGTAILLLAFSILRPSTAQSLNPGDIVIAGAFSGGVGVVKVDPFTGAQLAISLGGLFSGPAGVAITAGGDILVADNSAASVIKVNPASGAQTLISSGGLLVHPWGIAIEVSGKIVVADNGANAVIRVDPGTGAQTLVSSGG